MKTGSNVIAPPSRTCARWPSLRTTQRESWTNSRTKCVLSACVASSWLVLPPHVYCVDGHVCVCIQFEKDFLTLLSRRFGVRRVHSNIVYNEYIADKEHIHMTSTMWTTLTEFVKYLGRESKCVIDETEKVLASSVGWVSGRY